MDVAEIDCYLDFSCPWSYVGLVRLQDTADRNAGRIIIKPVSLNILLATENPSLLETRLSPNPAKAQWQLKDLQLWSQMWGIDLKIQEKWPFDAKKAAAAFLLAGPENNSIAYALAIYAAHFGAGLDISDPDVLADVAAAHQVDTTDFSVRLADDAALEQVAGYTEELIRRGGFGTPSMFLDQELFFGNDRIPLLEWRLGPISDADFVLPGQHGAPSGI